MADSIAVDTEDDRAGYIAGETVQMTGQPVS